MSGSEQLEEKRESDTVPTCSICNKPISTENLIRCSSCNQEVHRDCCKARGLIICFKCYAAGGTSAGSSRSKSQKSKSSASSSIKRRDLRLQCLEEEKALKLKELAIEKEFLAKKYSLLEQEIESDEDRDDAASKRSSYVNNWVQEVQLQCPAPEIQRTTLNPMAPTFQCEPQSSTKVQHLGRDVGFQDPMRSMELSTSQLNARKIVFELPKFSGKPKEWPHFITSFEDSTRLCGFQNYENISRLRHSLKGVAFDSVWPQLTTNGDVGTIISTLQMLFGRPELIIKELIGEISSTKPLKDDNLMTIMNLAMVVQNLVATIISCKMTSHMNNPTLLESVVDKLSASLKLQWGMRCSQLPVIDLFEFNKWLQEMALSVRLVTNEVPKLQNEVKQEKKGSTGGTRLFLNVHSEPNVLKSTCPACSSQCKSVEECDSFCKLPLKKKWEIVNTHHLCRTCLEPRHKRSCPKEKSCGIEGCSFKHHSLLHKEAEQNIKEKNTMVATQLDGEGSNSVFFKIVPVKLHGNNVTIDVFAFLDDGSGLTLMDQEISDQLSLPGIKQPLCLTWTGNTSRLEKESQVVSLHISSLDGDKLYHMPEVRTVKDLALPCQTLSLEYINSFNHLQGLPIIPYTEAKPRILIGLKDSSLGIPRKTFEGRANEPICISTRLGYVVFGNSHTHESDGSNTVTIHKCDCELHNLVNSYFSLESVGVVAKDQSLVSGEEKRAIALLEQTTRKEGNRYETGLLWRYDDVKLPDNLPMARKRLLCLKKKLANDDHLDSVIREQILDHVHKGYIRQLTQDEVESKSERTWYLPIFPVTNPNKPNKIRIVWDAAAKFNGISLNSMLMKGPDQLSSLVGVLQRFRQHKFAICGDIAQMFHQVRIRKEDQDSQRFLWFDDFGNEVVYVMQVMTFGASCSPSCAQYIKNQNATRFISTHPRAVVGITKNHYVDDFLDGMATEADLLSLAQDVRKIHLSGGFQIRNWISNSSRVLKALDGASEKEEKVLSICTDVATEKVLGLFWSTSEDVFKYRLKITERNEKILSGLKTPTKRQLLSTMMQIFDPLGFLSNVMIGVKLILQEVWKSGVEWDEPIKAEQFCKWKGWLQIILKIEELKIPRWHFKTESPENLQLHVFVDGSLLAYSAVAYFRYHHDNQYYCSLIGAKGKVASMKLTSVPRIELMGALIGARFAKTIQEEHLTLNISKRVFWCDSVTVLKWIHNDRLKFKQFVGFRIGEILELSSPCEWRYVPSKLNIADEATKSSKAPIFDAYSEWFNGPNFLRNSEENWPENIIESAEETMLELREVFVHSEHMLPCLVSFERYSSWKRACRVTGWIIRAISTWKMFKRSTSSSVLPQPLTSNELLTAENYLIKQCQYEVFPDEMIILNRVRAGESNLKLERSSPLYKETPYIDEVGIARRRGRIDAADTTIDVKRPILLPRNHPLTYLLISYYHQMYKHQNDETVINELIQKFVIPSVRVQLKKVKLRCQKCKNDRAIPAPPLMAELPPSRLQSFVRPFSYVGADYFGPIMTTVGRRSEKRWVMLLTCLSIRAIHIEVAGSLTTDSCIMCVTRFIARRGTPIEFLSDNGTNLKGAANELKAFLEDDSNQQILRNKFTTSTMRWKFITPGAPHMGGCWERLVRSVKETLAQIMPISNPSPETLHTMLLEVEAVVNSRPLTYVGVENPSQEALTPNHFLLGSSSGSKPIGSSPEFYEENTVLRKEWMKSQQLSNQFWIRWVREYLPKSCRRTKWYEERPQVQVGDVVILLDERTARNSWPRGMVVEIIKSAADGRVRSAVVRTQSGTYTRPVTKMAVLDVIDKDPEPQDHLQGEVLPTENVSTEDNIPSLPSPLLNSSIVTSPQSTSASEQIGH